MHFLIPSALLRRLEAPAMTLLFMVLGTAFAVCFTVVVVAFRKAPVIEDAAESSVRKQSRRGNLSVRRPSRVLRSGFVAGRRYEVGLNLSVR